jgi:DNA-binding LytR/AlgR family response regulator
MEIRCVAIDDEPLALKLIEQYVTKFPALQLVQTFDDAISGAEFLKANAIDLLLIDINMPDITGIELVRSLKKKPMIIFITAYKKFAIDGFEQNAIDYLLKPVEFERFSKAINKAIDYYQYKKLAKPEGSEVLFVNAEYQKVKVLLSEVEYIESLEDYIKIHLANKKIIMTLMTLKAMIEKLPPGKFIRIHRSYVVSVSKIKSVVNRKVRLESTELPISSSYVDIVNEWMKR